jgi:hypothetical protein
VLPIPFLAEHRKPLPCHFLLLLPAAMQMQRIQKGRKKVTVIKWKEEILASGPSSIAA